MRRKNMRMVILLSLVLFLSSASLYAEEPDTIFQNLADAINGKYEVEVTPMKEVTLFQTMADGIRSVKRSDASSAE